MPTERDRTGQVNSTASVLAPSVIPWTVLEGQRELKIKPPRAKGAFLSSLAQSPLEHLATLISRLESREEDNGSQEA